MVLRMPTPYRHPKTGMFWMRQDIPPHLRPYVGKGTIRVSLGTKDDGEAKRLAPAVQERFNAVIASAKAQHEGRAAALSLREVDSVLGEWYRQQVARWESEPGEAHRWDEYLSYHGSLFEPDGDHPERDHVFCPDRAILERVEAVLRAQGVVPDQATRHKAAERFAMMNYRLAQSMLRRIGGDWRPDPFLIQLPSNTGPETGSGDTRPVPLQSLVDGWAKENQRAGRAFYERQKTADRFVAFIGHADAARVTADDAVRFKEARLAAGVSPKTVANDINELQPIFRWAKANRKLFFTENPFSGIAPKPPKTAKRPRGPFSADEATRILTAARAETGFLRWLPFVLCYTGARLGEVCQAVKEDVRRHGAGAPWFIHIHGENAGEKASLKTPQSERMVPLHPALIGEGFLDHVTALSPGSALFPDIRPDGFGQRKGNATKLHGRWVRETAGVTDRNKDPAHAWRHVFEDRAHQAGLPQHITDALLGHLNKQNEGGSYGKGLMFMPDVLVTWLGKMGDPLRPQQ